MIISILKNKCPRCRSSYIFCNQNPYNLGKVFLMPDHCEECGLKINPEPGFYYGSMYVGYALSVAYLTSFYVAMLVLIGDFSILLYLIASIGSMLLFTPVIFRLSRTIWLTMFNTYDVGAIKKWRHLNQGKEIENPCKEV